MGRHRPTDRGASDLLLRTTPLLRITRLLRRPSSNPGRPTSNARCCWSGFGARWTLRRCRPVSMLSGSSPRQRSTRSRRPPGSAHWWPASLASTTWHAFPCDRRRASRGLFVVVHFPPRCADAVVTCPVVLYTSSEALSSARHGHVFDV